MYFTRRAFARKPLSSLAAGLAVAFLAAVPGTAAQPAKKEVLDRGRHVAADGEVFHVTKVVVGGEEQLLYSQDGATLTAEQLRQYEAAHPAPKVDEELLIKALRSPADRQLELVVWLTERPGSRIVREVRAEHLPAIQALAEEVRDVQRTLRPAAPYSPGEEESLRQRLGGELLPLTDEQRSFVDERAAEIDRRATAMRRETYRRATAAVADSQERFREVLAALGGEVLAALPVENVMVVQLPADQLPLLAASAEVARITEQTAPTPMLDNQIESLGVDTGFWADGIDGGIWDVGVLDSCLQAGHPNHSHVSFLVSDECDGTDWWGGGHGTQVTGIIASNDTTFRGIAPDIDQILIGSMGSVLPQANWMVRGAADDAEVINASFGWGTNTSDYTGNEKFFDGLVDDERVMVSAIAGNGGPGTMTLTEPGRAFNVLTVANVFDQETVERDDDLITASSSRGPTPAGRRKPDIAAPGTGTTTTRPDGTLGSFGGTSAAAPHVAAGLILLTELRGSDEPTALKAALLNTADAWTDSGTLNDTSDDGPLTGSAWNASYGWGYLDLWEAWYNGLDVFNDTVDDGITPAGLDFKLYKGLMYAGEKATLVWNRHVGYNGSNVPSAVEALTDLDLKAYRQADSSYIAGSSSVANNVEQIAVSAYENVVLKVEVYGSLDPNVAVESFALATEEGFARVDPPSFSFTANSPLFTAAGTARVFTATVKNEGDVTAFNNSVTLNLPSGFTLVSGANPQTLPDLAAGATTSVSWTIRWNSCTASGAVASLGLTATSSSYGESLSSTGYKTVTCENLNE